jgi:hypothetical protein
MFIKATMRNLGGVIVLIDSFPLFLSWLARPLLRIRYG